MKKAKIMEKAKSIKLFIFIIFVVMGLPSSQGDKGLTDLTPQENFLLRERSQKNCSVRFCETKIVESKEIEKNRRLDIVLVLDTSTSVDSEVREGLSKMDAYFLKPLRERGVDFKLGVLPAHSPKSSRHGKLEMVFTNNSHSVGSQFVKKVSQIPGDGYSDGGEMGMLSLSRFLKRDAVATKNRFFRENSIVLFLFVSDENDICATYPEGVSPKADVNKDSKGESDEQKAKRNFCKNSDGSIFDQNNLIDQMTDFYKKRTSSMLVSSLVYNTEAEVEERLNSGVKDSYKTENEVGHGYIDVVNAFSMRGLHIEDSDNSMSSLQFSWDDFYNNISAFYSHLVNAYHIGSSLRVIHLDSSVDSCSVNVYSWNKNQSILDSRSIGFYPLSYIGDKTDALAVVEGQSAGKNLAIYYCEY